MPHVMLLAVAFIIGLLNAALTGQLSVGQSWKVMEQLVIVSIIYWWYHTDKAQRPV